MCELTAEGSASRPPTCSCARPGSSGSRCRWPRSRPASRSCAARSRADGGADAAQAMLTTDTVRKEAVARAGQRDRRRDGEGRGDAVARDGDDARGAHHRRRGRARARCSRRSRRAVSETFDCLSVDGCRSTNDTVIVLANGRAGAVDAHALTDALTERVRLARRADGARRRRARPSSCGCGSSARAVRRRGARSRPARSPTASSCSARSTAATRTGAGCSRSSARAARTSIPSGSTSPTTASRCAATASRARTTRPRSRRTMAAREIEILVRSPRSRTARRTVLTTDLSHAYIDENRRTS